MFETDSASRPSKGSYFEGDEIFQLEMKICDSAGGLAASLLEK